MENNKKIIRGGTFITMDESSGDIVNGALLIEGNRISAVSTDIHAFDAHTDADIIDAQGAVVTPGMVDAHRHNWMALFRGVSVDESLPAFLINTFHTFGALMTADNMYAAVLNGNVSALNAGTTTVYEVNDCVNSPEHAANAVQAMKDSGIRGIYGYGMQVYDFKPAGFASMDARRACAREISDTLFSGQERLEPGMLLSDPGTVPFAEFAMQIRLADAIGLKSATHTGAAKTSVLLRGLRELDDHGLLLPGHIHAHSNGLTGEDWKLIAKSGGHVASTPSSELQMGMGFLPYQPCVEFGIPFALGTDFVGVTTDDLFTQMNMALQIERALANDKVHQRDTMPFEITPTVREALRWATLGGAEVLGLQDEIGSLTAGKKADIIIIRHKDGFAPAMHPAGSVVQMTHASDVDTVIADGVIRKRHGQLNGFDTTKIVHLSQVALAELEPKIKKLNILDAEAVEKFFRIGERMASFHFSQAYSEAFFAQAMKS